MGSRMKKRYSITAKSEDGVTQSAVRFSKDAAIVEARRQLFHKSNPSFVKITVDVPKGVVV